MTVNIFEYIILTALPVFIALFALQSRFFQNWRFLLASILAIYAGLWSYPLLESLLKSCYPREYAAYSALVTTSGTILLLLVIFFWIGVALSSHSGGGYHLPKSRTFLTLLPAALTGLLYAGLISYLICISPLHCKLVSTESFSRKAVRCMQIFTCIVDRVSLQGISSSQRKAALEKRLYPLIDPVKAAAEKAAKIRAEKEAAVKKAAEEKAAAEKAAAEKARLEAMKKKHRSGKVEDKFIPGQFGDSVRDSHPQPPKDKNKIPAAESNIVSASSAGIQAGSSKK